LKVIIFTILAEVTLTLRQGYFEENMLLLYWTGENLLGKLFGKLGY